MLFGSSNGSGLGYKKAPNIMREFIDDDTMKALYYLCLRHDIPDNNVKAEIARLIVGDNFIEVGTGTNRICFRLNNLIVKVALDRRGLVDNFTEYKRSIELPQLLAKVYESNYLINICEYVLVLDQSTFTENRHQITDILSRLAPDYLFEDVGFTLKNSCNWGRREAQLTDEEEAYYGKDADNIFDLVILDYGYLYPMGDQRDAILTCPKCGREMKWNINFTALMCDGSNCNFTASPTTIRRRMTLDAENKENEMISRLFNLQMPNLAAVESDATTIISKGDTV